MAKYAELQEQISKLKHQAEQQRQVEMSSAIEQIKVIMHDFKITEADLKLNGKSKAKHGKTIAPVQFRDKHGNEWAGRGRQPHWLQGKNKEDFRVK